ncbi:hypothetical protein [Amycolatopsis sp. NPDC051372]|uniref:hypothetical protein n=1 Tax=Amycolatopsis sp. NPDC051372 TaxID=3155669 RepID=UPI003442136D
MPVPELPPRLAVAEPVAALPIGPYEYSPKLDGWRMLVHVPAGVLQSRTGSDLTGRFPGVLESAAALGRVVLDGELCAYQAGRLAFAALGYGETRRGVARRASSSCSWRSIIGTRGRDLLLRHGGLQQQARCGRRYPPANSAKPHLRASDLHFSSTKVSSSGLGSRQMPGSSRGGLVAKRTSDDRSLVPGYVEPMLATPDGGRLREDPKYANHSSGMATARSCVSPRTARRC